MKKLFLVLAVASLGFVACNNDGDTKDVNDSTTTTTTTTHDSTIAVPDTTSPMPTDTLKKDTTSK